jgi:quinoprotein glucose dehydrogenase
VRTTKFLWCAAAAVAALSVGYSSLNLEAQGRGRGAGPGAGGAQNAPAGISTDWKTYGADLSSTRYSPLDQINKDNFAKLQVAWRLNTNTFGPRPDTLYSTTPLKVGNMLYATVGTRRAVVAMNPATGEIIWHHVEDEGERGQSAPRQGAGRGLSYWSSPDGADQRVIYVTPGYRMIALNAKTGVPVASFGKGGVVDLKLENDQNIDLTTGEVGLNATPLVAGDVVIVGAAHRAAGSPRSANTVKGFVRGFDVRTGKRLWIFHTIPMKGEFGYDTWEDGSAEKNGSLGMWAQASADLELGLVYLPLEMPPSDYYGVRRPGANLFAESLVAVDIKTGKRKWHYQFVHHGLWDWDLPCAPMLFDMVSPSGQRIKALAQPSKQAFLYVLNRETGAPIWPIEERPVPQSNVPGEKTSPTQPFPTKPVPFDRQGFTPDDVLDFTPALKAEGLEVMKRYKIGPIFTPPSLAAPDALAGTLMLPADVGGANWPGGAFDPETNRLFIHSHTAVFTLQNVPADLSQAPAFGPPEPGEGPAPGGRGRGGAVAPAGGAGAVGAAAPGAGAPGAAAGAVAQGGPGRGGPGAAGAPGRGAGAAGARGGGGGRGGTTVQGLPLVKPPYDRITAYNMNTGDLLWQKAHSSTSDAIKNNPALKGVDLSQRLGAYGRTFIGVLATKTLVIAGDGGTFTNDKGQTVALLRAYDKDTGADIPSNIEMPAKQTGSPMTYMHNGKQYIVLAVSGGQGGGELIAYALP